MPYRWYAGLAKLRCSPEPEFRTILADHDADSCAHDHRSAGRMHAGGFSAIVGPRIGARHLTRDEGLSSQDQAQVFRLHSIAPKIPVESLSGDCHLDPRRVGNLVYSGARHIAVI